MSTVSTLMTIHSIMKTHLCFKACIPHACMAAKNWTECISFPPAISTRAKNSDQLITLANSTEPQVWSDRVPATNSCTCCNQEEAQSRLSVTTVRCGVYWGGCYSKIAAPCFFVLESRGAPIWVFPTFLGYYPNLVTLAVSTAFYSLQPPYTELIKM